MTLFSYFFFREKGRHFHVGDFEEMGRHFCEVLLEYSEAKSGNRWENVREWVELGKNL